MEEPTGIIYIRNNELCVLKQIIKIGITGNGKNRGDAYTTYEHVRGTFIMVIEIPLNKMKLLDKSLKKYFKEYNDYKGGGTEYYKVCVIDKIVPYLELMNIKFKVLSTEEIDTLERKYRHNGIKRRTNISEIIDNLDINRFIQKLKINKQNKQQHFEKLKRIDRAKKTFKRIRNSLVKTLIQMSTTIRNKTKFIDELKIKKPKFIEELKPEYTPREDQNEIINKACQYFIINDKGLLVLICGIGKTLISLWITQRLNSQTILIGVPNLLLVKQWKVVISELFPTFNKLILIVSGNVKVEHITTFLKENRTKCIVITTYSSAHKVYTATQADDFKFDMKINDECHHLTAININSSNSTKKYIRMLNIGSSKQLSLTATLKNLETSDNIDTISNDNVEYFGEIIDRKSLLWGIKEKIICNYVINTITSNEELMNTQLLGFNITNDNDKRLMLAAYTCLKSIESGQSHHAIIYANSMENSIKICDYITDFITYNYFNIQYLYYSHYTSEIKFKEQRDILTKYNESTLGILTCVYCLGEGYDNPIIGTVVFAENMTSNIRIVQSALRAFRKDKDEPDKLAKILIPVLIKGEYLSPSDLQHIKEITCEMGTEDETITQKIKVYNIEIKEPSKTQSTPRNKKSYDGELGEYNANLTSIIKLQTRERTSLGTTYAKACKILADKNIQCSEDYLKFCESNNKLPKNPIEIYKETFKGWIEYLNIRLGPNIYDFETCKKVITQLLIKYPDLKRDYLNLPGIVDKLCKLDPNFPPKHLWEEYYKLELRQIIIINIKGKKTPNHTPLKHI